MADNAEHVRALNELRNRSKTDRSNACTEAQREIHTWRIAALDAAILALSPAATGEPFGFAMEYPYAMPSIACIAAPDFVVRRARAEQLRDGCLREYGKAAKIIPLYTHPQPQGVVSEDMVERAVYAFTHFSPVHSDDAYAMMRAALTAAFHPPIREGQPDGR